MFQKHKPNFLYRLHITHLLNLKMVYVPKPAQEEKSQFCHYSPCSILYISTNDDIDFKISNQKDQNQTKPQIHLLNLKTM